MRRTTVFAVIAGLAVLMLSVQYGYSRWDYARFQRGLQARMDALTAVHQERLDDAPRIARERIAYAAHMDEWERRTAHDPELASTAREKTLVRMQALAQSGLTAVERLKEIATLASPRQSNVKVRGAPGQYRVHVTFNLTELTSGEQGSATKHKSVASLKREVVSTICRIMRDLYRHCGTQDLRDVTVGCQRGVLARELDQDKLRRSGMTMKELAQRLQNASPISRERLMQSVTTERLTTMTIYRAALDRRATRRIGDWQSAQLHEIENILSRVEDEFPNMKLVVRSDSSSP